MGVPALFRWLSQKYPKIISPVIEEQPREIDGATIPVDPRGNNPNGEEFDNLYLDMNGIVHPCSHPEDKPPPATEEQMMLEVFKYTERVVNMVRPRKLLMIAVDGVAPRAKMNQQRSRRFRSAQEAKEKDEDKAEFLKMLKSQKGDDISEDVHAAINKKTWDSNAITPGTPFMDILAASLRYWTAYKLNTDPSWEKIKIIISDATVPGEGEHKIMEFIRSQRRSPEHDPNTRHVLYGLDADLIMLGLATHEPHFRVLREDVFFQESRVRTCKICGQAGHKAEECRGEAKKKEGEFDEKQHATSLKPFIWLHVSILREYLAVELSVPGQLFRFDLERAIDDWIFMCFFVGNDFLPHLPSLDIRDGGIDTLIAIWRDNIPLVDGYVTKDGHVDMSRVQCILASLAKQEDAIFKRRRANEVRREANAKRRKMEESRANPASQNNNYTNSFELAPSNSHKGRKKGELIPNIEALPLYKPSDAQSKEVRALTHEQFVNRKAIYQSNEANKSAAAVLKEQLRRSSSTNHLVGDENLKPGEVKESTETDTSPSTETGNKESTTSTLGKRKAEDPSDESEQVRHKSPKVEVADQNNDMLPEDTVQLWEKGYSDRYYEQKFKVDPKDIEFRHKVARAYAEGLAWVLLYYFQGCPSWTWYYPYHYAPFAADFVSIDELKVSFEKGKPFRPYEQLMGVLPAASNHAIPEPFRDLMENEESDIIDFYPAQFPIDLNGKKFAWQGVALLPFIDEKRLLKAMDTKYHLLGEEEIARNELGKDALLFSTHHPLYEEVAMNFYSKKQALSKLTLKSRISEGLAGHVEKNEHYIPQSSLSSPLKDGGMPDLDADNSISMNYEMPRSEHIHKSMLLRGVKFPAPKLDRGDIENTRNRSIRGGRSYGGAPLHMDNYRPGYHNNHSNNNNRYGGYRGNGYHHGHDRNNGRSGPSASLRGRERGDAQPDLNPNNPFAAHLNPNFAPEMYANAGFSLPPPPPPQHTAGAYSVPQPQGSAPQGYYGKKGPNDGNGSNQYGYGYGNQGGGGRGWGQRDAYGASGRGQNAYGYGNSGRASYRGNGSNGGYPRSSRNSDPYGQR